MTWMQRAIGLGVLALGKTGDNPNVGCVLVRGGQVLGEGFTQPPGGSHAEVQAQADAQAKGFDIAGADLYTTVEPCSFHGRTPSCARAIVDWGIKRVLIGIRDPHPRVNGAGIRIMTEAGIEVVEGVCNDDVAASLSQWLNGCKGRDQ